MQGIANKVRRNWLLAMDKALPHWFLRHSTQALCLIRLTHIFSPYRAAKLLFYQRNFLFPKIL
jgi:hypothetical protein